MLASSTTALMEPASTAACRTVRLGIEEAKRKGGKRKAGEGRGGQADRRARVVRARATAARPRTSPPPPRLPGPAGSPSVSAGSALAAAPHPPLAARWPATAGKGCLMPPPATPPPAALRTREPRLALCPAGLGWEAAAGGGRPRVLRAPRSAAHTGPSPAAAWRGVTPPSPGISGGAPAARRARTQLGEPPAEAAVRGARGMRSGERGEKGCPIRPPAARPASEPASPTAASPLTPPPFTPPFTPPALPPFTPPAVSVAVPASAVTSGGGGFGLAPADKRSWTSSTDPA
eukprot:scaffold2812_cov46-Isochrysis_galbana.AAC.1